MKAAIAANRPAGVDVKRTLQLAMAYVTFGGWRPVTTNASRDVRIPIRTGEREGLAVKIAREVLAVSRGIDILPRDPASP